MSALSKAGVSYDAYYALCSFFEKFQVPDENWFVENLFEDMQIIFFVLFGVTESSLIFWCGFAEQVSWINHNT